MSDLKRLSADPPDGISGCPFPNNIMKWNAVIFGPGESDVIIRHLMSINMVRSRYSFRGRHVQATPPIRGELPDQTTNRQVSF